MAGVSGFLLQVANQGLLQQTLRADPNAPPTGASFIISASDFNGVFAEVPSTMGERGQMHQLNLSQFPRLESTVDLSNPVWQSVPGYVEVVGAGQTVRYPVPHPGTQT